jgi:predicted transcriptional regulator
MRLVRIGRSYKVRLHFYVSKQLSERVERVGVMLGHPKARAAAFLLDNASQVESHAIAALDRRLDAPSVKATILPKPVDRPAEDESDEIVLLYVRLESHVAERIEELAKKRALSQSRVCAWLLARAVEDEKWIVNIVQTRLAQALAKPAGHAEGNHERRFRQA